MRDCGSYRICYERECLSTTKSPRGTVVSSNARIGMSYGRIMIPAHEVVKERDLSSCKGRRGATTRNYSYRRIGGKNLKYHITLPPPFDPQIFLSGPQSFSSTFYM